MCNDICIASYRMSWSNDKTLSLIHEYKQRTVLWQKRDKCYYDNVRKEDAWRELSDIFDEDIAVLKKKIESLRGSRRREKNRVQRSRLRGRTNSYISKWFAWDALQFLEDPKTNYAEQDPLDVDFDEQVKKRLPHKRTRSEDSQLKNAVNILQSTVQMDRRKDECSMFGEYIAEKLRKHDSRTRMMLQHQIHNVLYEAEMNMEPVEEQIQSQPLTQLQDASTKDSSF